MSERQSREYKRIGTLCLSLILVLATAWGCVKIPEGMGEPQRTEEHPGLTAMAASRPLADAHQLVLVVTEDWDSPTGRLFFFQREPAATMWKQVDASFACRVGEKGLGWGRGMHFSKPGWGPIKAEGDGRGPAGAFSLSSSFGYAPGSVTANMGVRLPYIQALEGMVCVDDQRSGYYNDILDVRYTPLENWSSSTPLLRRDGLYKWGLVIGHNQDPVVPGAGSCVFMHVDAGPNGRGTACPEQAMLMLLTGLDPAENPVLVQLPRKEYELLREAWGMPRI